MSSENPNNYQQNVKYFDIENQIMPGDAIQIFGKRASGKSILLNDIISKTSHYFDYGIGFTASQSSRQKLLSILPPQNVETPNVATLEDFVEKVVTLHDKAITQGTKPENAFLICDSCDFDKQFMQSKTLNEIVINSKKFNATSILLLSHFNSVGPSIRNNADFVFQFWDANEDVQRDIHKFWFSQIGSFELFQKMFKDCTVNYGVLVIDVKKSAVSHDWHDCVYWYKATKSQ